MTGKFFSLHFLGLLLLAFWVSPMSGVKEIEKFVTDAIKLIEGAGEKHEKTTEKPCASHNPCPPSAVARPALPPCVDRHSAYICQRTLEWPRNVTYCRRNWMFGRINCCKTCAREWSNENGCSGKLIYCTSRQ